MKKKAIIIDIDGVLADSWNDQKECFCGDNLLGEEEYNKRMSTFPKAEWVINLMRMYNAQGYYCILLTSRLYDKMSSITIKWLNDYHIELYDIIYNLIFRKDQNEKHEDFKLKELVKLSKKYDIEFILDDDPKVVKVLQENGFRALLCPTLYEWEAK